MDREGIIMNGDRNAFGSLNVSFSSPAYLVRDVSCTSRHFETLALVYDLEIIIWQNRR